MPTLNRVVVVGGSTGSTEALKTIVNELPDDLPAAVLVVHHLAPSSPNLLADILGRAGALPAATARDGEPIIGGRIYTAAADHHLLVAPGDRLRVARGPKENRARPAIDPLFRSAAAVYGPRTIGVILSGLLDDGTAGLWTVRARGGITIVQNPEQAIAPSMPLSALKQVEVNHCVVAERIGLLLADLVRRPVQSRENEMIPAKLESEIQIAAGETECRNQVTKLGQPSIFACPECHGVLMELKEGAHVRYRCHTGHAYSEESLLADLELKSEDALWNALRSLEETEMLLGRLATQAETRGQIDAAARIRERCAEVETRAKVVCGLISAPRSRGSGR